MDGVKVKGAGSKGTGTAPNHGVRPDRDQVHRVDQIDRAGVVEQRRAAATMGGRSPPRRHRRRVWR